MRRLVVLALLAVALGVPAVALAVGDGSDDGTLSVRNGAGKALLQFNGSALGRVAHGRVTVTDPILGDGVGVTFWGCDKPYDLTDSTTTCIGDGIRFRAIGGKYRIFVRGSGIYLSAVGHGTVFLNGRGDEPNVDHDGAYSLNDGPYKSLPDLGAWLTLEATAAG
jgi:hypothetical protein